MNINDYHNMLREIADIDVSISSIADSKRLMVDLNEREQELVQLKKVVTKEIHSVEMEHLKKRRNIQNKYPQNRSYGIIGLFMGSNKKRRIKALKHLDKNVNSKIEAYSELKYMTDDLLLQIGEIKRSANNFIKESLGNQL